MTNTPFFNGTADEPTGAINDLPVIDKKAQNDPKDYRAGSELTAAVNVALTLGMPLLLTGEPGCGKSELARRIAWELGVEPVKPGSEDRVLKYVVKSTTEAKDLFYTYDTVGRFHAAQTGKLLQEQNINGSEQARRAMQASQFITYQALGLALLRAKGKNGDFPTNLLSEKEIANLPLQPTRSLVLIDEIDKAPRDVPNDILSEIENFEFTVPEVGGAKIELGPDDRAFKPIIIITSNSERDLPPAFLRRCVYFHVPFPPFNSDLANSDENPVTVEDIVQGRLGKRFKSKMPWQSESIEFCRFLRMQKRALNKLPSLAEILNWLGYMASYIDSLNLTEEDEAKLELSSLDRQACLLAIQTTLLKTQVDQARAEPLLTEWINLKQKS